MSTTPKSELAPVTAAQRDAVAQVVKTTLEARIVQQSRIIDTHEAQLAEARCVLFALSNARDELERQLQRMRTVELSQPADAGTRVHDVGSFRGHTVRVFGDVPYYVVHELRSRLRNAVDRNDSGLDGTPGEPAVYVSHHDDRHGQDGDVRQPPQDHFGRGDVRQPPQDHGELTSGAEDLLRDQHSQPKGA